MLVLVNGATRTVATMPTDRVGHLMSPAAGNSVESVVATDRLWAADNSAFSGFNADAYLRMLWSIARCGNLSNLLFVVAPDVVGDAQETANLWLQWFPQFEMCNLHPWAAFVGQDGMENLEPYEIPWDEMAAFFIGGSTAWKLGEHAERFAREAKARGKWVHMGRVNSAKRIRHAIEIGCDSIDGRSFSAWPDRWQPWAVTRISRLRQYRSLF